MRITDVCPLIEDAVCVASLYICILRMLYRIRRSNQTWRSYPLFLLSENRWRAQRYGVAGTLFDFGKGELVAFRDLIEELLGMLREDAQALGCRPEVEHARTIVQRGTSADRQVACFNRLLAEGASRDEALRGVVDQLIAETGSDPSPPMQQDERAGRREGSDPAPVTAPPTCRRRPPARRR
jgi:carboxylate-amine ligase